MHHMHRQLWRASWRSVKCDFRKRYLLQHSDHLVLEYLEGVWNWDELWFSLLGRCQTLQARFVVTDVVFNVWCLNMFCVCCRHGGGSSTLGKSKLRGSSASVDACQLSGITSSSGCLCISWNGKLHSILKVLPIHRCVSFNKFMKMYITTWCKNTSSCYLWTVIVHQVNIDFAKEPVGKGKGGKDVFLKDIWPSSDEVAKVQYSVLDSKKGSSSLRVVWSFKCLFLEWNDS